MKIVGMLGGLSWSSSLTYYRVMNEYAHKLLGGWHSARCVMFSFDFAELEALQIKEDWAAALALLRGGALAVKAAGAEGLLICTNTMHMFAHELQAASGLPVIHIGDAVGQAVRDAGLKRVALLGTRYTMQLPFYRDRLAERFGLEVITPDEATQQQLHSIIYDELVHNVVTEASRAVYQQAIDALAARGAEGVILGCTEIQLLFREAGATLPLFDSTELHARSAIDWAISGEWTARATEDSPSPRR